MFSKVTMVDRGSCSKFGPKLPAAVLAAAALCACAQRAEPTVLPDVPLPQEAAVQTAPAVDPEELYLRAARAEEDYGAGIELIASGDEVGGEDRIAFASGELRTVAEDCALVPNCEVDAILEVFERLLGEHEVALKTQVARVTALEVDLEQEPDPEREPGTSPFVAQMPELGRTESLLHGTDLRDMIELNGPVKAAIDDWLTWMRPMLMEAYENYSYLRQDIAPIYEEAGLPEALLFAMIATESGGKVHSYSRAGAAGLLQFMRRTGYKYGLREVNGFDLRLDPAEATRANVAYLNDRFAELNANLEKSLAAYNGGEGRLAGLERRLNGASLWDNRMYYSLPRETREYVPRILAASWLFLHPEEHGLRFPVLDTERAELVLQQPASIGELTVCLGQEGGTTNGWFRTLRNLNPRLDPGDLLETGQTLVVPAVVARAYEERCVGTGLSEMAHELYEANYPPEPEMIPYIVRPRDTLGRIASRYRCTSIGELAAINNVRAPRYTIRVGQMLKIPSCN